MPGIEAGPRITFERHGKPVGKQPPIVGDYCERAACDPVWCKDIDLTCPRCKAPYCRNHYRGHFTRMGVPRDAWRQVRRRLAVERAAFIEANGVEAYRALPFILGSYCKTPSGRRALAACGYESSKCRGEGLGCLRCKFTYCDAHFKGHVVRFTFPREVLLRIHKQFQVQLDEVADRRRRLLRIKVPKAGEWS